MNTKFRITFIGNSRVGKTTLIDILRDKESNKYNPTIFDCITHYIFYDNINYELQLIDTSGQEDYVGLRHTAYQDVDLVIICFAVDNKQSWEYIESRWIPELNQNNVTAPKILLGLKNDTRYNQNIYDTNKILTTQEGKDIAQNLNIDYLEFGKTTENMIDEITNILIKGINIINLTKPSKKEKNKCWIM